MKMTQTAFINTSTAPWHRTGIKTSHYDRSYTSVVVTRCTYQFYNQTEHWWRCISRTVHIRRTSRLQQTSELSESESRLVMTGWAGERWQKLHDYQLHHWISWELHYWHQTSLDAQAGYRACSSCYKCLTQIIIPWVICSFVSHN